MDGRPRSRPRPRPPRSPWYRRPLRCGFAPPARSFWARPSPFWPTWRGACVLAGPDIDTDAYAHHMIARGILADPARPGDPLGVAAALSLLASPARGPRRDHERRPLGQRRLRGGGAGRPFCLRPSHGAARAAGRGVDVERTRGALRGALRGRVPHRDADGDDGAARTALRAPHAGRRDHLPGAALPELRRDARGRGAPPLRGVGIALDDRAVSSSPSRSGEPFAVRRRCASRSASSWCSPCRRSSSARGPCSAGRSTGDGSAFSGRPVSSPTARRTSRAPSTGGCSSSSATSSIIPSPCRCGSSARWRSSSPSASCAPSASKGARFVLVLTACLAFVSFSWVMRSSLGLDRHFVEVVPLYATFAAQGAAAIADGVAALAARVRVDAGAGDGTRPRARRGSGRGGARVRRPRGGAVRSGWATGAGRSSAAGPIAWPSAPI